VSASGFADFILSFLDQLQGDGNGSVTESASIRHFDLGLDPDLRLAVLSSHVNMHTRLFS
jgi:hypothetical protein